MSVLPLRFKSGKARRALLSFLPVFIFLSSVGHGAATNNMVIEANYVLYEDGISPTVVASGDVYFKMQKLEGHAQRLNIDWASKTLDLDGPFQIEQGRNIISGQHMNVDGESRLGSIENFEGRFRRALIRSDKVLIKNSVLEIDDATFTTCNLPKPHTHLSAKHITIYAAIGMIVIRDAVFWIQDVPVFYLPTYIIGGPALLSSSQLLPDVLNDSVQGLTIRQRLGYLMDQNNAGHAELAWTQNLGWGIGLTHGLRWRNRTDIEAEAKTFGVSGLQGHLNIKSKALPKENLKTEPDTFLFGSLFSPFAETNEEYLLRWNLLFQYRELVNYQRLSILPEIEASSDQLIPGLNLKIASGYFEELAGQHGSRIRLESAFDNNFPLMENLQLHGALDARHSAYDRNQAWDRVIAGTDLIYYFEPWTSSVGYAFPLVNQGASPFLFDSYQVQDSPEYRFSLRHDLRYVGLSGAYKTTTQSFRTLELSVEQPLHEWSLVLTYEAVAGSLSFAFRLADL